jgi:pimeloyl-ACP methyl ester carboxylesterase
LSRAGEAPPYVLFPHSMAGLEAIYWAKQHPDEVEAIIGLDPLVPGYHEATGDGASPSYLITVLARTGLMRSGPDVFARNFPAMIEGRLSQEEAAIAETIFMRRTNTPDMWAEARALPENAATAAAGVLREVPFHAIIAGSMPEIWVETVAAYAQATGGEATVLDDAGHYLHVERPALIAELSQRLIEDAARD